MASQTRAIKILFFLDLGVHFGNSAQLNILNKKMFVQFHLRAF